MCLQFFIIYLIDIKTLQWYNNVVIIIFIKSFNGGKL